MKKKSFRLIVILIFLISCNEEKITHPIEGEWVEVLNAKPKLKSKYSFVFDDENEYYRKLSFYSDSTMERVGGFYKQIGGHYPVVYLGKKTPFKIIEDKLLYFDLSDNKWVTERIVKLDSEFLIIESEKFTKTRYKRLGKNRNPNPKFQKIIFSQDGCYGQCPMMDIIINSDGNITFYGEVGTHIRGLYTAKISKSEYLEILNSFKYVDIKTVNDYYSVNHTDDLTYDTTIIVNNKIYKSIHDYGLIGPSELFWALFVIRDLYQNLNLTERSLSEFPVYLNLKDFSFKKGNTRYRLTRSESFYLWDCLRKGKISNKSFESLYQLEFYKQSFWRNSIGNVDGWVTEKDLKKIIKIETEGRFYKFYFTNKEPITMDIGFNFFQDLPLDKKFEKDWR